MYLTPNYGFHVPDTPNSLFQQLKLLADDIDAALGTVDGGTGGGGTPSGPAGGDLSGLYPDPFLVAVSAGGSFTNASITVDTKGRVVAASSGSGYTAPTYTTGSVLFATSGGAPSQDNANFFWDDLTNRLGLGLNNPATRLEVRGSDTAGNPTIRISRASAGGTTAPYSKLELANQYVNPTETVGGVEWTNLAATSTYAAIRAVSQSVFGAFTDADLRFYTLGSSALGLALTLLSNQTAAFVGAVSAPKYGFSGFTLFDVSGASSPEGAVTAAIGSTFRRTDGATGTTLYVKETGAGNTGWVAVRQTPPCTTTAGALQYNNSGVFGCSGLAQTSSTRINFPDTSWTFGWGTGGGAYSFAAGASAVVLTGADLQVNQSILSGSLPNIYISGNVSSAGGISFKNNQNLGWSSGSTATTVQDIGFSRYAAGVVEVNKGNPTSAGSNADLRDIRLRSVNAISTVGQQLRLGYDGSNYTDFTVNSSGLLTVNSTGAIEVKTVGRQTNPWANYYENLGAINKKWLSLHAAELVVDTLVAQDVMSTIGGRIIVAPTTQMTSDYPSGSSYFNVKHNNLRGSDFCFMESRGQFEMVKIVFGPADVGTSGWQYSSGRNYDGSGANDWLAGDAVVNTGQAGDGFIDMYSTQSIKPGVDQPGPTIVGNVRYGTLWNQWSEAWAIGNLKNLYGYPSAVFGVGLGQYGVGNTWITIDSTYGYRAYSGSPTVMRMQLAPDGSGFLANNNISWTTAGVMSIAGWVVGINQFNSTDTYVALANGVNPPTATGVVTTWFGKSATGYGGFRIKDGTLDSKERWIACTVNNAGIYPYLQIYDGTYTRVVLGGLNYAFGADGGSLGMGMKIWNASGQKLVEFSDTQNMIAGWTINTTSISNNIVTLAAGVDPAAGLCAWFGKSAGSACGFLLRNAGNQQIGAYVNVAATYPYLYIHDGTNYRVLLGGLQVVNAGDTPVSAMGMRIWNSAGVKLVEFGNVNTIAGWTIDTNSIYKDEVKLAAGIDMVVGSAAEFWFGKGSSGYYGFMAKVSAANGGALITCVTGSTSVSPLGRPYLGMFDGTRYRVVIGELNTTAWGGSASLGMGFRVYSGNAIAASGAQPAVAAGTKIVELSDVQCMIAGWNIAPTLIQSTGIILYSGASAALSVGVTPPTAINAGTGIWLEQTGLYCLSAGAQLATVTGVGGFDCRVTSGSTFVLGRAYSITENSSGETTAAFWNVLFSSTENIGYFDVRPSTGRNSTAYLRAAAPATKTSSCVIDAGTGVGVLSVGDATGIQLTTNSVLRWRIDQNGNIVPGNAAANLTTATQGFMYILTSTGPPTGVPATAYAGRVVMQYDTTNNQLYVYNGAWKKVALA